MIVRTLSHEGLVGGANVFQLDETSITYDEWTALVHRTCLPFDMVYSNSELVRLLLGWSFSLPSQGGARSFSPLALGSRGSFGAVHGGTGGFGFGRGGL